MDGDVRMIVRFYTGNAIGEAEELDQFLELAQTVEIDDAPLCDPDDWPDRSGEWRWCTYRHTDAGRVAIVAEKEGE